MKAVISNFTLLQRHHNVTIMQLASCLKSYPMLEPTLHFIALLSEIQAQKMKGFFLCKWLSEVSQ